MHKRGEATVNQQHPPSHHPLDARYYSVLDEPNFTKFHPEKYDFNLYKRFPMKKKTQIRQILKEKNPNCQIFKISSSSWQPRIQKDSGFFLVCSHI
jgi:hypothetical protein